MNSPSPRKQIRKLNAFSGYLANLVKPLVRTFSGAAAIEKWKTGPKARFASEMGALVNPSGQRLVEHVGGQQVQDAGEHALELLHRQFVCSTCTHRCGQNTATGNHNQCRQPDVAE